jgi:anti-anti-sigma regulatory factor
MAAREEIEIDLSEVTDIDTAGLQLMLAAKRMPGKTLRFVGHGAPVLRIIELANVGHTLGDPLVLAA